MTSRRFWLLPVLAGLLVVSAACGGGDGGGPAGSGAATTTATGAEQADEAHLDVTAGDIFFKPKEATVPAGHIAVSYVNDGQLEHTLLVEGRNDLRLKVERGGSDRGVVELQTGDYTLYCDVPGHRAAGMVMKLHVL